MSRRVQILCLLGAALSCSRTGLTVNPPRDAGLDAAADAATVDAGQDAGVDGGPDACTIRVSSSGTHTCAVVCGDVWCWGNNEGGSLGDGTFRSRGEPRRIAGLRARQVSTSNFRSCAALEAGGVACWGVRSIVNDRSPPPVTVGKNRPEIVAGIDTAIAVSAGVRETCALREDGDVYCWSNAAVGDPVPIAQVGLGRTTQLTVCLDGTCVLDDVGVVRCRSDGPNWDARELPGAAVSIDQACANVGGRPYCWNYDVDDWVGWDAARAVAVPRPIVQVTGSFYCGRARAVDGRIWTWGDGPFCDKGLWSHLARSRTIREVEGYRADGVSTACAWAGAQISCWGPAASGAVGDGRVPFSAAPLEVAGVGVSGGVSLSEYHACAFGADSVSCWGSNVSGEVGPTDRGVYVAPQRVPLADVAQLAIALFESAAVDRAGTLWAWGFSGRGDLSYSLRRAPLPYVVTAAAVGYRYNCVARADGGVNCWGYLRSGLREEDVRFPGVEVLPPGTAAKLVVGHGTVCGIDEADTLTCIGENVSGDLGIGGPTPVGATPPLVVPDVLHASISESLRIEVYNFESPYFWRRPSCLIRTSGALECWGYNGLGHVGDGTYEDRTLPTPVSAIGPVQTVDVGPTHTCAIDFEGVAWCWGDNTMGQLGDGTDTASPVPVRVLLDEPATHISVAASISCAQVMSGRTYCWGTDYFSMLGRSDPPQYVDRPQRVILAP